MNILIIGNGFDLAHGLPTKYWDFLMFVKCVKEANCWMDIQKVLNFDELNTALKNIVHDMKEFWRIYSDVEKKEQSKKNLVEFKKIVDGNVWLNYFLTKLNSEDGNKGWIDFELEISKVIKSLDYLQKHNKKVIKSLDTNIDDNELYDQAITFIDEIINADDSIDIKVDTSDFYGDVAKDTIDKLINELNNLIKVLEIYLIEFIGKIYVKSKLSDIIEIGQIDKILSFNYTDTYEKYYDNNYQEDKYDYIHGKIRTSNNIPNNMVLGIDEYLGDDKKDKELDFIQFKKYFQRIYKKTGCEYRKWVEDINKKNKTFESKSSYSDKQLEEVKTNLYIFGHSLDITDKDILRELIMLPRTTTTIYYHDNNAYKQYIVNLVKLIGQDKLTDWVHGSNPRIKLVQQQF